MNIKVKLLVLALFTVIICQVTAIAATITGPVAGSISSLFGLRNDPINGFSKFHHGIDIAAPYGAPVYAMQDGVVIESRNRGGYGLVVVIDHYYPDIPRVPRVQTYYGHCSTLIAKPGQFVRRGQVIALVGSTGRSTGPHLHFEVRYLSKPVDPIDYLVKLPAYLNYIAKVREHRLKYASYSR